MINLHKSILRFSKSAINILKKFDEDFYVNNYLTALESHQFQTATLKIQNTNINLLAIPRLSPQMDQLTDLILKDQTQSNYLVQFDPTPFLFAKRALYKEYHNKFEPLIQSNIFEQLPILPLDLEETRLDMNIFDLLQLIKEKKQNSKALYELLEGEGKGRFEALFEQIATLKQQGIPISKQLEDEGNQASSDFADLLQSTILYPNQSNMTEYTKLTLFQSVYISSLKGANVFLGDLSNVYQRIYFGIMLSLPEAQQMFKDICGEFLKEKGESYNVHAPYLFEFQTMVWRQMSIEYYLLYSINHFIKNTQESELTVVVDSVHFDPLRLAILGQKNELIEEIERGYHHEFSFPKSQILENDEQMLEKHAIFDSLLQFPIWDQQCVKNPFPYLSKDFLSMSEEEKKEIQEIYFKYQNKYNSVMQHVRK